MTQTRALLKHPPGRGEGGRLGLGWEWAGLQSKTLSKIFPGLRPGGGWTLFWYTPPGGGGCLAQLFRFWDIMLTLQGGDIFF